MSRRALIAGIGNVFFADDGFGVEVARRLRTCPWPPGVEVVELGVRGLHLAFELLDPFELLILIDASPRGGAPGELYVIDPELEQADAIPVPDAHGMDLPAVFAAVRAMGGALGRVRIVGCEPAELDARCALSEPVAASIEPAVALIRTIVARELPPRPEEIQKEQSP